ncbi:hypothetical protein J7376_18400 [Paracoccus sp. R12_1]|uniref:hypothetical protein n=1 Tax=Paracoccus sp. TaxID=267 RepID=UPI001B0B27B4|nr:hypothetical protein [Paracoccus sp. R12_2]MBO9488490.1 hypothetical protein [Paracoccus sp. R12_1]
MTYNGDTLHQRLKKLVESTQYRRLRDDFSDPTLDPRVKAMRRVIDGYREAAKRQLMEENPEILKGVRRRTVEAAEAGRMRRSGISSYGALAELGK